MGVPKMYEYLNVTLYGRNMVVLERDRIRMDSIRGTGAKVHYSLNESPCVVWINHRNFTDIEVRSGYISPDGSYTNYHNHGFNETGFYERSSC